MPKINALQTSFSSGEFSPMLYGQVHADRYKAGLKVCLNYIPTLQGPLTRRPGTKYVGPVKDPAKPPALIPFIFNETQAYMLEFDELQIRFYANGGTVITNSNVFTVVGSSVLNGNLLQNIGYSAVRTDQLPRENETIVATGVIGPGLQLLMGSPYLYADLAKIKWAQKDDTLYLTHQNYPPYKLQRFGQYDWKLSPVITQDGPYLPENSYAKIGDSARWTLSPNNTGGNSTTILTGPSYSIYGAASGSAGAIRLQVNSSHIFRTGDKVFVTSVNGTTEANNSTVSTADKSFWRVTVVDNTHIELAGSTFVNALVGSSGLVYPALFQMYTGNVVPFEETPNFNDAAANRARNIALFCSDGFRHWGLITGVNNPASANVIFNDSLPNSNTANFWWLGVYSLGNGYPRATCFHQDRLIYAGAPNYPQEIDGSQVGDYDNFAASGSSIQVSNNNALQFNLLSEQSNPVMWIKSAAQGLLAGALCTEWQISPDSQSQALTPTNRSAQATSYFGSADADAVQSGNAVVYVQRSSRKIREMNFFFQVGTFRSTDLTEIAEHITIPTITKLAVQREPLPLIWGLRSDGNLVGMSYSRDDQNLKAGWARHQLGGQSDSAGTNPIIKSIAVIPTAVNSTQTYDQMWMVVQRSTVSGSTFTAIEYMTRPYDDSFVQEDAFQGDCGATYDSPIAITGITSASSAIVTATAHGLSNGDEIRIVKVVGLNSSLVDVNGYTTVTNLVNEKTFTVGSSLTNTFALLAYGSSAINATSYGSYVSGGEVRKLVSTISGLSWLNGETLGVLADGAIHPDVTVFGSGTITLNYKAAKVQLGYRYNSDGQDLDDEGGSAQGTSIGELKRISRVAFQLHNAGDLAMGSTFTDLETVKFQRSDVQQADQATPLFSGTIRDSIGASYSFEATTCWRQNSMLPGMILSLTEFIEVQDV